MEAPNLEHDDNRISQVQNIDWPAAQPTVYDLINEGWSVIPVRKDKTPLLKSWKPYSSQKPSEMAIKDWEQRFQPPIWAGTTGPLSARFTLDFDGKPGIETMKKLGLRPHRKTPRGFHVDFHWKELEVRNLSQVKKALADAYPGMDIRGNGGYICVLGSSITGDYEWLLENRDPYDPSVLPEELINLITGKRSSLNVQSQPNLRLVGSSDWKISSLEELNSEALNRARSGRNEAGFWLACKLRDSGCSLEQAEEEMRRYQNACPPTNPSGEEEPYAWDEARASLMSAWSHQPIKPSLCEGAPKIVVNNRQLPDVVADAMVALKQFNEPPVVFNRSFEKVTLSKRGNNQVRIEQLEVENLKGYLSCCAQWIRNQKDRETKNVFPLEAVVRQVLHTDWSDFPELTGVIDIPMLRSDGTLLDSDGYDAETGKYLAIPPSLNIPPISDVPSDDEIQRAKYLLGEALEEFPFVDEASHANAMAFVLSMVLLPSIPGLLPMALITAPKAGTGKSFLVSLASTIATGGNASASAPPKSGNDEEFRKFVTAALLEDCHLLFLDNVEGRFSSTALNRALTGPSWTDRRLGETKVLNLPQHVVWAMTGNNIELAGDLPRRCYLIEMDPKVAQPSEREFKRPDLLAWVADNRGDLLWACFTLARNWILKGKNPPPGKPFGSFNGWQFFIGGILHEAGVPGFLENRDTIFEDADPDQADWINLLTYFHNEFGGQEVATRDLMVSIADYEYRTELPRPLSSAFDRANGTQGKLVSLSKQLGRINNQRFDDSNLRIEKVGVRQGASQWRILRDPLSVDTDLPGYEEVQP